MDEDPMNLALTLHANFLCQRGAEINASLVAWNLTGVGAAGKWGTLQMTCLGERPSALFPIIIRCHPGTYVHDLGFGTEFAVKDPDQWSGVLSELKRQGHKEVVIAIEEIMRRISTLVRVV